MRAYALLIAVLVLALVPPVPATGSCTPSANDCFADAIAHYGLGQNGSNFGATMETDEPAPCDITRSVWYTATPRSNGTMLVELTGEWFSSLAAYSGSTLGGLTTLACSETWYDPEGTPSDDWFPAAIGFTCVKDQPVRIQVGGQSNATGSFGISMYGCALDPTLPSAPKWCGGPFAPCAVGGVQKVDLDWVRPDWDGGDLATITSYKIYRAPNSCAGTFAHVATTTSDVYSDTGLPHGATYCYRITAVNVVGEGPPSVSKLVSTLPLARPPETVSVFASSDGELQVTWTRSPDDVAGKPRVTGYRVYSAPDPSGPYLLLIEVPWEVRNAWESNLGRDVSRWYFVTTVNTVGEGVPSAIVSGTTPQPPSAPQNVLARETIITNPIGITPFAYEVTWEPPAYAPYIQAYDVYVSFGSGDPSLAGSVSGSALVFRDRTLTPGFDHHYTVVARNAAGASPPSEESCISTPAHPLSGC